MTLSPIERRLEDATVLYVKAQAWKASIGLFAELARIEPDNANAWFGIGSAMWRMSLDAPELLEPAVATLKRAAEENKQFTNKTYKQLLFSASQSADKAGYHSESIPAFSGDTKPLLDAIQFTPQMLIEATQALDWESRIKVATLLSEVPGELFDALLNDLAENDSNSNVRTFANRALRDRPQKPAPMPVSEAQPAAAVETLETAVEPQVTMADAPAEDIASAIPHVTEVIPVARVEEAAHDSAEIPVVEVEPAPVVETPVEAPAKPDPKKDEAIRAQLEARRQRLMGKK
ncbi:MAG: hypothetical protein U0694_04175 [Anaerolineae bacterium]